MIMVVVSKMGVAGLFFVKLGVKVNGKYYRDVLLWQQMLPAIRHVVGDNFVFQQDSAPAHLARDTFEGPPKSRNPRSPRNPLNMRNTLPIKGRDPRPVNVYEIQLPKCRNPQLSEMYLYFALDGSTIKHTVLQ